MEKCGKARQATNNITICRMRFACWIMKDTETHSKYVMLVRGNTGYANTSQCYLVRTLPVLLTLVKGPILSPKRSVCML